MTKKEITPPTPPTAPPDVAGGAQKRNIRSGVQGKRRRAARERKVRFRAGAGGRWCGRVVRAGVRGAGSAAP